MRVTQTIAVSLAIAGTVLSKPLPLRLNTTLSTLLPTHPNSVDGRSQLPDPNSIVDFSSINQCIYSCVLENPTGPDFDIRNFTPPAYKLYVHMVNQQCVNKKKCAKNPEEDKINGWGNNAWVLHNCGRLPNNEDPVVLNYDGSLTLGDPNGGR
ncbi:hypothetical protein H2203_002238 [Taxawa tesnikishii (nom. ined.)]|nr:hypothetical protein H2203_002238 [Dothideales sp. JES 119]